MDYCIEYIYLLWWFYCFCVIAWGMALAPGHKFSLQTTTSHLKNNLF